MPSGADPAGHFGVNLSDKGVRPSAKPATRDPADPGKTGRTKNGEGEATISELECRESRSLVVATKLYGGGQRAVHRTTSEEDG